MEFHVDGAGTSAAKRRETLESCLAPRAVQRQDGFGCSPSPLRSEVCWARDARAVQRQVRSPFVSTSTKHLPQGSRPDRLSDVRPQERVQRLTVDTALLLDVPVPLMEEQLLLDVFRPHDREVPEVVIEVPKIICEDIPTRSSAPEPQLAEQLVEVPTHPRYALAVVAVQTLEWRAAAPLSISLTVQVLARGGGG